jgi:hypothetical protein
MADIQDFEFNTLEGFGDLLRDGQRLGVGHRAALDASAERFARN